MSAFSRGSARGAAVAAFLVAVGVFCWAWGSAPFNLRERVFPKNLAEVEGGWLYRSGQIRPNLIEGTLRELKIDVIVDLTDDFRGKDKLQNAEVAAAQKLGIEIRRFPMRGDGVGTVDRYVGAVAEIARAGREGKHVLVHCRAGDRRTGGVLSAYEVLVKGETVEAAREEMERFTPDPSDESKLTRFLDEHLDEIGQGLIDAGVIERMPDSVSARAAL
jgi:protein tyrosine/serine phosphatase